MELILVALLGHDLIDNFFLCGGLLLLKFLFFLDAELAVLDRRLLLLLLNLSSGLEYGPRHLVLIAALGLLA